MYHEPFLHRGTDRGYRGLGLGSGHSLTIACKRLEIASAHSSLRLFPAPDAWRYAAQSRHLSVDTSGARHVGGEIDYA
jgi:hypothetical protein